MKQINIEGMEDYSVTEDGMIFSHRKQRYLKPSYNTYGYMSVFLTPNNGSRPNWYKVHRLVAYAYISLPPFHKAEVDHIDNNRMNNHVSNLRWTTHSDNVLQSYIRGRDRSNCGRPAGYKIEDAETISKMAQAKYKPVIVSCKGESYHYDSIEQMLTANIFPFKMYRKKFNKIMHSGHTYKGFTFTFV